MIYMFLATKRAHKEDAKFCGVCCMPVTPVMWRPKQVDL